MAKAEVTKNKFSKGKSQKKEKKDNGQPHTIMIQLTNKVKIPVESSYGKEGDVLVLDIDPLTHQAWNDDKRQQNTIDRGQVASFNRKFKDFGQVLISQGKKKK